MTIIKGFCGTAEAVPFPNELHSAFFSSLLEERLGSVLLAVRDCWRRILLLRCGR